MAWDTEATKQKLLNAAIDEFAERGFAGARIQEIAKKSGCNRERIYFYFDNKIGLFEAALVQQLVTALDDVPVRGTGPEAVADFAGRYFDFSTTRTALARLTVWEGLERGYPVGAEQRALRSTGKVAEIQNALPSATMREAEDLLLTIVTLCNAWVSTPNIHLVLTGAPDLQRRRASIVRTSELLAQDTV
ncbi:TetR family transcriptional regulator [Paeniglutamicibacter terrestris]|uniref:TetR/AcrR family transcriptional regulator n=1 Tax=Paeniglutamicibacter terrestris TaxID=2723403 RepID=A0ABX1G1J0_9MICC|nr:TetR family transcriptional regulator [Paeniglutamicibacter terrestris]NKG19824.1 TetR/AcrR family transcriptional regulator [Paeniglutamicibacter terrestris]